MITKIDRRVPKFALSPKSSWVIARTVPRERRRRLLGSTPFPAIVARLKPSAIIRFCLEDMDEGKDYVRFFVVLKFSRSVVDLWHNSRGGIRGQYYVSSKLGEAAERYAIRCLFSHVEQLRAHHPKFCASSSLVRTSVLDRHAKIRIYPRRWIRCPSATDRKLFVPEWAAIWQAKGRNWTKEQGKARQLALRGALLPGNETRLQIKGGWVRQGTGRSLGRRAKDKESRPCELHNYGCS
jgi:hypothetical protein